MTSVKEEAMFTPTADPYMVGIVREAFDAGKPGVELEDIFKHMLQLL